MSAGCAEAPACPTLPLATSDIQIFKHFVYATVVGHVPAGLGVAESLARDRVRDACLKRQPLLHGYLTIKHPDGIAGTQADPGQDALRLGLQFGGNAGGESFPFGRPWIAACSAQRRTSRRRHVSWALWRLLMLAYANCTLFRTRATLGKARTEPDGRAVDRCEDNADRLGYS